MFSTPSEWSIFGSFFSHQKVYKILSECFKPKFEIPNIKLKINKSKIEIIKLKIKKIKKFKFKIQN